MSHESGAGCRRKQTPSRGSGCPSCGSRYRLTGGGKTRRLTRHFVEEVPKRHPEITRKIVSDAQDNWVTRGVRYDRVTRRPSINYLGVSPDLGNLVRVVVSIDDEDIVTAFQDGDATTAWRRGDMAYFRREYQELEVRDEPTDDARPGR